MCCVWDEAKSVTNRAVFAKLQCLVSLCFLFIDFKKKKKREKKKERKKEEVLKVKLMHDKI